MQSQPVNEILTSYRLIDKSPGPLKATNHADYNGSPAKVIMQTLGIRNRR